MPRRAADGAYLNQCETDRRLEIDANTHLHPDNGYTSCVRFDDGEIFLADDTNDRAPPGKALLKGYRLQPVDL